LSRRRRAFAGSLLLVLLLLLLLLLLLIFLRTLVLLGLLLVVVRRRPRARVRQRRLLGGLEHAEVPLLDARLEAAVPVAALHLERRSKSVSVAVPCVLVRGED